MSRDMSHPLPRRGRVREGDGNPKESVTMSEPRKNEPKIDAEEVLGGIVEWVSVESPSHDAKSVNKVVDHVEGKSGDLGLKLERIPGRDGFRDILECKTTPEMSQGDGGGKGILV